MDFPGEILFPQKVIFKRGAINELGREALEFGPRGIVVCGPSFDRSPAKEKILKSCPAEVRVAWFVRQGSGREPTLNEISEVISKARKEKAVWIAGIGGGSVLDLAKAAAGLFHAKEPPAYYQEGGSLCEKGIPFIAVPTTAGSGSEVSINSVIINPEKKTKLSIRDKSFMARKVILDAELLQGLPPRVICFSGMDALVQAYESYISKNATWFSEVLALKAVELLSRHLQPAFESRDIKSLEALLLASYLTGVAFSVSRLGVIHGIAHPLGVLYDQPHGLICAVCFIPSIKIHRTVIGEKYDALSRATGVDFLGKIESILKALQIRSPFQGEPVIEKEKIIYETLRSGSTAASPKTIERADVEFIMREIF